jgi:hypothetical protein
MVAAGLLVLLGAGLAALLSQSVAIWNRAESRGLAYEKARVILEEIAEDLRSAVVRTSREADQVWIRFLADLGPEGRGRLRFVRTIPGEVAHPILRAGGQYLGVEAPAVYDGEDDAGEAQRGVLAAPAGLLEVFWCADPRPGERRLWRGVRSPIGGGGSLFIDENVESAPPAQDSARAARGRSVRAPAVPAAEAAAGGEPSERAVSGAEKGAGKSTAKDTERFYLEEFAAPVGSGVLFLGFRFWTPATNTWRAAAPLEKPRPGELSGPSDLWDSTRAFLDAAAGAPGELGWRRRSGSRGDPSDDLFPELVEVTLVLEEESTEPEARLALDLAPGAKAIDLSRELVFPEEEGERFVLVDEEWVLVSEAHGRQLLVAPEGRGARRTQAASHAAGAAVRLGLTFRRVVVMPSHRTAVKAEAPAAGGARRRGGLR